MKQRKISKDRYQFEYEYYMGAGGWQRMLHVKIYSGCAQTDLWLNEKDQKLFKEILEE